MYQNNRMLSAWRFSQGCMFYTRNPYGSSFLPKLLVNGWY
jgi:hypothetical protein